MAQARPSAESSWPTTLSVGIISSAIALWAIPRHVQAGDSGELATVMLRGGVAHPSGYPWMRILGLSARALEAAGLPPMVAASVPCALCGVVAFVLLQRCLCPLVKPWACAVAVLLVATAPVTVLHVNDAEVWGPLLAFAALFASLALRRDDSSRRVFLMGLVLGCATSQHLTAVLLAPWAVGAAWPKTTEPRALLRAGGLGLVGVGCGLLVYATLMVGADGAWRWGDTRTLGGLLHHVSRGDYGVFSLSLHQTRPSVFATLSRAIGSIGSALGGSVTEFPAYGLVVLAAIVGFARRPSALSRPCWWGLWGSIAATTIAFPAMQNIDPASPFGRFIVERFDLLPLLLWSIPTATVLDRAWDSAPRRSLQVAMLVVVAALGVGHALGIAQRGVPSDERAVEQHAIDILRAPPGPAIIFGTDDHRTFPILYAQAVLGVAPHVTYVDASLLAHPWYRDRLSVEGHPGLPFLDKPLRTMGAIWEAEGEGAPPIFLANVFSRPSAALPRVPEGPLWRVLPPDSAPPTAHDVASRALDAYSRCEISPAHFALPLSVWAQDLRHVYTDKGQRLAEDLRASGAEASADRVDEQLERLVGADALP